MFVIIKKKKNAKGSSVCGRAICGTIMKNMSPAVETELG